MLNRNYVVHSTFFICMCFYLSFYVVMKKLMKTKNSIMKILNLMNLKSQPDKSNPDDVCD